MPTAIDAWTQQQWGVFVTVIAAGLLAALLAPVAVRTRADVRARRWTPSPGRHVAPRALAALYPARALPVVPGVREFLDEVSAHVAPGAGSLTSLREVGPGHIVAAEPLVDADIAESVGAALDAALETFRVAVEPAMRTARLWMLRGGETYAENALRTWHLLEQTAEYPTVTPDGARA